MYYNKEKLTAALQEHKGNIPFDHCVIEDFLLPDIAKQVEAEFLSYEDDKWFYYKNAIEDKKALNDWNVFPSITYKLLAEINSNEFISILSETLGFTLYPDPGLHGGGWHIHAAGGNLNPHLDYSIHPKIGLQRKLNIIIYLSSQIREEHGGSLGLWAHDEKNNAPGDLIKSIYPKFNRAVIFDTTQNSWHGMSQPLSLPSGIYRKSLAVYYLTHPPIDVDRRERALFAARDNQKNDKTIAELIRRRSDAQEYASAYREEDKDSKG